MNVGGGAVRFFLPMLVFSFREIEKADKLSSLKACRLCNS